MKTLGIVLCALVICGAFVCHAEETEAPADSGYLPPPSPYWLDAVRTCGPVSLRFLDGYFGGDRDYRSVIEACPPRDEGTSLSDLQTTAEEFGYHTAVFHGTAEQLKRLPYPAILHFEPSNESELQRSQSRSHFIVSLGWDTDTERFATFDPPRQLDSSSFDDVARRFTGTGLVVSDKPLPPVDELLTPEPRWRVALAVSAWGSVFLVIIVRQRRKSRFSTRAARQGTAIVVIWLVATMAGCSSNPEDTSSLLPSKEKGLHFDAGRVRQGEVIRHVFRVYNPSDQILEYKAFEGQ